MSKFKPRRRLALDDPEEVLDLAHRGLEFLKRYKTLAIFIGIILLASISVWSVHARMQASRETKAAETLTRLFPLGVPVAPGAKDDAAIANFLKEYGDTKAGARAELMAATMFYRTEKYAEAARAYEALQKQADPALKGVIAESLSYCYEQLGDFKKAAITLKPAVEEASGALKNEIMYRLALLYEKAQEPGQAAVYWRKLLEQPANPTLVPYFQEKAAAAEALAKK